MSARSEGIKDEADYVNAAVCTEGKTGTTSDQKFPSFTKSFPPLAACWVTLLIIMALRIYFSHNLATLNHKLRSENEQLRLDHHNLTQGYSVLESEIKKRTEENQELKNNFTEQIQDMETKSHELNVSRAQWSIDAYCPRQNDKRQCEPCQRGWRHSLPSCFAIIDAPPDDRKTWDEAREHCKGIISDLVVINNQEEKTFINDHSWRSSGTNGYWIGLRVKDGRWKWVDGTDLTEDSWIQQHPPPDGHCAISVQNEGWKSVNCTEKKMWICEKTALSV